MKHLPVFIPCYFGDKSVREKRIKAFETQVEWFLSLDERIVLFITIMDPHYKPAPNKRIYYFYSTKIVHPSVIKNRGLKEFYNSEAKWCILADNDSILYDHFIGEKIFSHMLDYPKEWSKLDMWYPINPINEPFNWRYRNGTVKQLIYFETASVTLKGSLIALRNTGTKVFFNENRLCSEDTEFLINMIMEGKRCYKCVGAVLKELVQSKTQSTFEKLKNPEDRKTIVSQDKLELAKKYPPLQAKVMENGNVNFITNQFYKKYRVGPKNIKIPIDPNDNPVIFKSMFNGE